MLNNQPNSINCYPLSERAITIEFGYEISDNMLAAVNNCNNLLLRSPFLGFISAVPAYATLTVFYDPVVIIRSTLPGADCFEKVSAYIKNLLAKQRETNVKEGDTITIPVCYGGAYGPDLDEVAKHHNISIDDVVHLHSSAIYKVYMIGFLPGFAYMGGLIPQLATPRKATPRKIVPAGSVGIAGQQTGVYPLDSPGGWQLIGQTPLSLFNINKQEPALLKAGDNVVFKPISIDEFKTLAG